MTHHHGLFCKKTFEVLRNSGSLKAHYETSDALRHHLDRPARRLHDINPDRRARLALGHTGSPGHSDRYTAPDNDFCAACRAD